MQTTPSTHHIAPRRRSDGFTLLEVLVAVLLAMIGLMGTVAVQSSVMNAQRNSNDSQIAMRLATQALEELNARITRPGPPVFDQLQPLAALLAGNWSPTALLDASGAPGAAPQARFTRRIRVINQGALLPYLISVQVNYALDSGAPRVVQLDIERRKTW